MDREQFDGLAQHFATAGTRRGALKQLAAAGLGLRLAGVGAGASLAGGKRKVTERCDRDDQCAAKLICSKANSQHSCFKQTEQRCCKKVGAPCNDGCECCGVGVICNGGYCGKT